MTKKSADPDTLIALTEEIERLRARLEDAEQILGAIRNGEVDALVIAGTHGDQVFSLTSVEHTYRLVVETMNEAALTVDPEGTILFCNKRFCNLMKNPMKETIGRKAIAFVASAQRAPLLRLLADAQSGPVQRTLTLKATDGTPVSAQIAASLLATDNKKSICLVVSDLTELEATANSIRVLTEQQKVLEERTHELEEANATLSDSRLTALKLMEDALDARREAEESSAGLRREIAERRQIEEELRQAKESADAANSAKSQFLANMSHELRTPMTGVLGMLQIALEDNLEPAQRERIDLAHKSARSLLGIINDILDLSRVEAGKLVIEEEPFNLRGALANSCDILFSTARHKGLDLVCSAAEDVPENVAGDRLRLMQVLMNLVGNAIKFTEKGRVEIRVETAGERPDGKKEISFSVTDTGIGIPDAKKSTIFQSFNQADASHSRRYGGAGLGLTISKKIVELMAGRIDFESMAGLGSTFRFTIPLAVIDKVDDTFAGTGTAEPAESGTPLVAGDKPRILVAEDDQVTRNLLGHLLGKAGFEHAFATDGIQTVEMWEKGSYDLIVMDGQMPGMDGFEATRVIRERESGCRHIPIIAVTAHAFQEDKERCLSCGMDGYVTKPIEFKVLLEKVREHLTSRKESAHGQTEQEAKTAT